MSLRINRKTHKLLKPNQRSARRHLRATNGENNKETHTSKGKNLWIRQQSSQRKRLDLRKGALLISESSHQLLWPGRENGLNDQKTKSFFFSSRTMLERQFAKAAAWLLLLPQSRTQFGQLCWQPESGLAKT